MERGADPRRSAPRELPQAARGEVLVPCDDLAAELAFLEARGFALRTVFPADDPRVALLSGHGLHLRLERCKEHRLERESPAAAPTLALPLPDLPPAGERSPGGTLLTPLDPVPAGTLPPLVAERHVARADDADWVTGRAGMRYRDLLPSRAGGFLAASLIAIPDGGPVPDYVHHHDVHAQVLFCRRGWVEVVYEDQGPPFRLEAGDGVLQPPGIRHRVLACSPGLEVVELSAPAEHATHADAHTALPTPATLPGRRFGGQRFVHHRGALVAWSPRGAGLSVQESEILEASGKKVALRVVRMDGGGEALALEPAADLRLAFVLEGRARCTGDASGELDLAPGDALFLPPGEAGALTALDAESRVLCLALVAADEPAATPE